MSHSFVSCFLHIFKSLVQKTCLTTFLNISVMFVYELSSIFTFTTLPMCICLFILCTFLFIIV